MDKTRIAIIGAGNHALKDHYPALHYIDRIDLCAACDLSLEKAKKAAVTFKIPAVYTDYREMIEKEKPSGVVVVLRPMELTDVVLDCMEKGLDLLIEKPPGCNMEEANRILQLSHERNSKVMVSMNRRFYPLINKIKELVDDSQIVYCSATYNKPGFTGNSWKWPSELAVADAIHLIDLMVYICGDVDEVYSLSAMRNSSFTNSSSASMLFKNGNFGTLNSHFCVGKRIQRFELHAHNISAYLDLSESPEYELWVNKQPVKLDLPAETLPSGLSADSYYETLHFEKWLRGEVEPISGLDDVIKSVKLSQAVASGYKGKIENYG